MTDNDFEFRRGYHFGIAEEQERIIKIVTAYLDPEYSEAWRPYYDEIARNLIPRIRGEK